jgi:hypothetical protein
MLSTTTAQSQSPATTTTTSQSTATTLWGVALKQDRDSSGVPTVAKATTVNREWHMRDAAHRTVRTAKMCNNGSDIQSDMEAPTHHTVRMVGRRNVAPVGSSSWQTMRTCSKGGAPL